MVSLRVFLVAASLASHSGAEDAADFGFGADVAKHFVMPPSPDHVHEAAAEDGKPVMVMLMKKGSPVCNALKKAIKNGSKVKALLDSFTVAYAEDSIEKWSTDKYVPQVIFYHKGVKLEIESGHKSGKYLYADEAKLVDSMEKVAHYVSYSESLAEDKEDATQASAATGKAGCSGSADCEDIDDKEMCAFTDGCSWSSGGGVGGPCQGGAQCKGIDEQDMCEFTDGCNWTGEQEDDFEDNDDAGKSSAGESSAASSSAASEHSFKKELANKMLLNVPASKAREAAYKANKPLMVLLTQGWCAPCKGLIKQINEGTIFKGLVDNFVVAHSTDDNIHDWQESGANYVPQTYFFDAKGTQIKVPAPNVKFQYFYETEYTVTQAMKAAQRQMKKANGEL